MTQAGRGTSSDIADGCRLLAGRESVARRRCESLEVDTGKFCFDREQDLCFFLGGWKKR